MKTLLLLRHGKSSRDDAALADQARPLAPRGRKDAPRMGRLIRDRELVPDAVVSSPAVRARSTALLAAEAADFVGPIRFDARIYEASVDTLLEVVRGLPDGEDRVLLVGHNPGFEDLLAAFSGTAEHFPTGALARVELSVDRWSDVEVTTGRVTGTWRPKALDD